MPFIGLLQLKPVKVTELAWLERMVIFNAGVYH